MFAGTIHQTRHFVLASDLTVSGFSDQLYHLRKSYSRRERWQCTAMQSGMCWWSNSTKDISATTMLVFDIYDYDALILSRINLSQWLTDLHPTSSVLNIDSKIDYACSIVGESYAGRPLAESVVKLGVRQAAMASAPFLLHLFRAGCYQARLAPCAWPL